MVELCASDDAGNPGLVLGAALAAAVRQGRDKLTLVAEPGLEELADWIEQLVAESTGKEGSGIVPLTRETPGMLERHASERCVVELRWGHARNATPPLPDEVPVLRYSLPGPAAIGGEFYRWQVAVALAGHWLSVNPFDEPDVALAKQRTAEMLDAFEAAGELPWPAVDLEADALSLRGVPAGADPLRRGLGPAVAGGYTSVLAFLPETDDTRAGLAELRELLGARGPVTLGWGPRYLHSSGQLHKGGPQTGAFLLVTAAVDEDVEIPDRPWGFGTLAHAQALGDAASLRERGRPVVHAHLAVVGDGLRQLAALLR